jgi:hypothetical protein
MFLEMEDRDTMKAALLILRCEWNEWTQTAVLGSSKIYCDEMHDWSFGLLVTH